jgi:hypothetical protein
VSLTSRRSPLIEAGAAYARRSQTLPSQGSQPTQGSPPSHVLPSPPPSPPPFGDSRRRHRFETRILPCTASIDAAEAELATALVMIIGRTRPVVTLQQVKAQLNIAYQVTGDQVQVWRSHLDDFLLFFEDIATTDRVLHAPPPLGTDLVLRFQR